MSPVVETNKDARNWATLAHLAGLAGYLVPLGSIVGPFVVWLLKKDELAFVDDQGKEALNFQITMTIAAILCIPLVFIVIGIFLLGAVAIVDIVLTIVAAIRANGGEAYRYPLSIRLVK